MKLTGKTAIVTGSGRGIGQAISTRFVAEGARVIVADLDRECALKTADQIGAHAFDVDVTHPARVEAMVCEAIDRYGRLDILVNNAGIGLTRSFLNTTLEEWERVIRVNLTGVFVCSQVAARAMARHGGGKIINISSLSAQRGGVGRAAYGAAKAGVTILTKVMSVELAPLGITVNEIAPGPVNTEMTRVTHDEATRHAYYNLIPMRRYAERDDIAAAALFLASDESNYINGHTLNVDGGFQAAGLMFELRD